MDNLRISTITAVGHLFTNNIDLNIIYEHVDIDNVFRYVKYFKKDKGIDPKKAKNKKNKPKKDFFNQMTLHIYDGIKKNDGKVNLKIFNNGRVQMTGLIKPEQGGSVIQLLHDKLVNLDGISLVESSEYKIDIALINSDFNYGQLINRDRLYEYVLDLGLFVTYESCIYPGVKIGYYYKRDNPTGICDCEIPCNGKGDGINTCRRVTIAAFHSGNVIITGGRTFDQLEKSYIFIRKTLDELIQNN